MESISGTKLSIVPFLSGLLAQANAEACTTRLLQSKEKKNYAGVIKHHKHGFRKRKRCCRTAKYSRYQADSNPRPRRVWPDHGPLGFQGSYPRLRLQLHHYIRLKGHLSGSLEKSLQSNLSKQKGKRL